VGVETDGEFDCFEAGFACGGDLGVGVGLEDLKICLARRAGSSFGLSCRSLLSRSGFSLVLEF
jgi:hypothetical protein